MRQNSILTVAKAVQVLTQAIFAMIDLSTHRGKKQNCFLPGQKLNCHRKAKMTQKEQKMLKGPNSGVSTSVSLGLTGTQSHLTVVEFSGTDTL
jgi:hypothetical protein